MPLHPLDEAMSLQRVGEGRLAGVTSDTYWNFAGPFGGYTAALFMKAFMDDERLLGPPVAQTVNFCAPIAKGAFEIVVLLQRSGKATQHWSLTLSQNGIVAATSSIVCANRRDTFAHISAIMPVVPSAAEVAPLQTDGRLPWLKAYDFRYVEGPPGFAIEPRSPNNLGSPRTVLWLKDAPDRPLDYVALSALCDCFILRLLQMRGTFPPMSTVSLTSYFHATPDELTAQGTQHLLGVADAKRFSANFHDQSMEMWGADGRLLASGIQTVWYKE